MSRARLRPDQVADHIRQGGYRKIPDGQNLYLVTRNGRGYWVLQYREGKTIKSKGLGSAATVSPAKARQAREAFMVQRRNGAVRQARAGVKTFGPLVAPYLDNHAAEWGPEQFKRNGAMLRLHASVLNDRLANKITVEEVADMLRPIWQGPGNSTGSKVRGLVEKILNAAGVERNPAAWARLRDHLSTKPAKSVPVASLPYTELPSLMIELATDPADAARAIRFVVLTGVRLKEALGARWREVDPVARTWTIRGERMKMKEQHIVPLSDAALACIGPRGADGDFIFPSKRGGHAHMRAADPWTLLNAFKRIDPEQGKPITLHGFRSTMSVWAQEQKPPFAQQVIDRALAHKERDKTRAAYLRSNLLDERRKLADQWAKFATVTP